jgi:light-regulated signal transduction histidine kinase (bacteriophytochrome)
VDIGDADNLGHIVEHAPDLIYVYDQVQHKNAYTNRCIGQKLGYSNEDIKAMGADLMPMLIHPDDLPSVFSHFAAIRELEDGEAATLEYRLRHNEGHWVWLLSHDTVYARDAANKVTHHIGAASDISAQKLAESEALAAQLKETATNEELKEFAYAISHDMKAPSNTMKLILTELQEELCCAPDSPEGHLLSLANTTIDRMQRLVEDVLHYTQVIGQELRLEKIDLEAILRELTILLKADIHAKGAEISIGPLPCVKGSETQLMILFQNLISNALKFSRPGIAPKVHINAKQGNLPNTFVISVSDNGVGIPEERFDQIFKLFKKLGSHPDFDGTGLGLAACRRIALNHNSLISVDSVVGEGSTFYLELEAA